MSGVLCLAAVMKRQGRDVGWRRCQNKVRSNGGPFCSPHARMKAQGKYVPLWHSDERQTDLLAASHA